MSLQRGETLPQCSPHATCLRGQSQRPSDSAWGRTKMVVRTSFSKGGRGGEGGKEEGEGGEGGGGRRGGRGREEGEGGEGGGRGGRRRGKTKTSFRYKNII